MKPHFDTVKQYPRHTTQHTTNQKLVLAKVGLAKVGRTTMAKVGLAKVGFDLLRRVLVSHHKTTKALIGTE